MTRLALIALAALAAYCLALTAYGRFQRGKDRMRRLLGETRPEPAQGFPVSALAVLNPRYRFRRYSSDVQLVTRPLRGARSALSEESR